MREMQETSDEKNPRGRLMWYNDGFYLFTVLTIDLTSGILIREHLHPELFFIAALWVGTDNAVM